MLALRPTDFQEYVKVFPSGSEDAEPSNWSGETALVMSRPASATGGLFAPAPVRAPEW